MKEILITSSVLIAVILLTRWLFRGKVSQRLIYAAWLLVALRLLIPIQFGQSQYSVSTLTDTIEKQSVSIQQAQDAMDQPISGPTREELYEQLLNEYIQHSTQPVTPEVQEQIKAEAAEQITAPTTAEILTAVWIGGIAAMAVWFLLTNIRFLHRARKDAEVFPCEAPVRVRLSSHVSSPCLVGVFRPVIYLTPASVESPQSLNHILTHEITHLRHWDHIWSLVRCLCLCIYWFHPLVWVAAILSKRDCELACDESALKKLGDDERIAYGRTLLAIVTHANSPAYLFETATAMNDTKKQLKERVNFIVKKPRNLLLAVISLILVTAITAGCTFTGSKKTEPAASNPAVTEPSVTAPVMTDPTTSDPTLADPIVTDPVITTPPTTATPSDFIPTLPVTKIGSSNTKEYRPLYYTIYTGFLNLLTPEQHDDWIHYLHTEYLEYRLHGYHVDRMLLVIFIQRYSISRSAFDEAVNHHIAYCDMHGWNIRSLEGEVPNGDIIYTFNDEIINEYYHYEAPIYDPPTPV